MKSAARTVVARAATEQPKAPQPQIGAPPTLQAEFKRRVDARTAASKAPAASIREALTRWLEEEL